MPNDAEEDDLVEIYVIIHVILTDEEILNDEEDGDSECDPE